MTAVLATFVNAKPVPTRSVLQLVFEVKIEDADAAMKALGGYPLPAESRWVGIALSPAERKQEGKKKRAWDELSPTEQAALRANDADFILFLLGDVGWAPGIVADEIRKRCLVKSRAEFNTDKAAGVRWKQLEAQFQDWLVTQRYAESRR